MPEETAQREERTCFVIGPIGDEGTDTRRKADFLFKGIISEVLEGEPFRYSVTRADTRAGPGMITEQVINDVIGADLVVADLSEHNPNAFYELAIRHRESKPTIHMISEEYALPFDLKDHRAIIFNISDWERLERARLELRKQAKAIEEHDYVVSNPVTGAIGFRELRQSGDSRDRIFLDLSRKLDEVASKVGRLEHSDAVRSGIDPFATVLAKRLMHGKRHGLLDFAGGGLLEEPPQQDPEIGTSDGQGSITSTVTDVTAETNVKDPLVTALVENTREPPTASKKHRKPKPPRT